MQAETQSMRGGCRCGEIRYICEAEPLFSAHCHCRDCQYASGGGFSTIFGVPTAAVSLEGELGGFTVTAASGNELTRKFCTTCGSPILTQLHANATMLVLKAATLDDPSVINPAMHIWTSSGQPWSESLADLPKFEKSPS